jgi:RHS repeat-associated protein
VPACRGGAKRRPDAGRWGETISCGGHCFTCSYFPKLYAPKVEFSAVNYTLLQTFSSDNRNQLVNVTRNNNSSCDLNGNLVSNGLPGCDYDCANELIRLTAANPWTVKYTYDASELRRIRQDYTCVSSQCRNTNAVYYVYDGMQMLPERNVSNPPTGTSTRSHSDGTGNVTMLVDGSGNVLVNYVYESFGNTLEMWGTLAKANTYRFSCKEVDWRIGQYYYGYRYYWPNPQKWLNHDPIGENGGINLYAYVDNDPINWIDPLGLKVSLILFSQSELQNGQANALKYPDNNSVYSVTGHGNPQEIADQRSGTTKYLSPAQLAELIKSDPQYKKGEPVKLIACNTGTGKNSFAQQLANILGTTVYAPDGGDSEDDGYAAIMSDMSIGVGYATKDGSLDTSRPISGLSSFDPAKSK